MTIRKPMILVGSRLKPIEDIISRINNLVDLRLITGDYHSHHIYVNGYSYEYSGQDSIMYYWDSVSVESENILTVIKATGVTTGRWKILLPPSGLSVKFFGAVGNGVIDDTIAIQTAIDTAIQCKISTVFMPEGRYKINSPIHLGYGDTYRSINLIGIDQNTYGDIGFPGTTIDATSIVNAMAINVQGGRYSKIKNLSICGPSYRYGLFTLYTLINSHNVLYSSISDPNFWSNSNIPAQGRSRYAPSAGITIDAYSGTRPATSYPDVAYPAWTGIGSTQYGKPFSSGTTIENVVIDGFYVGVVNQPCDADGNGDFTSMRGGLILNCAYGFAVCNTQSRNVKVSDVGFQFLHTCFTSSTFGRRDGHFGGPIDNCAASQIYQVFEFNNLVAGPITFNNFYSEVLIRLGSTASAGERMAIQFNHSTMDYFGWISENVLNREIYNVPMLEGGSAVSFSGTTLIFRSDWGFVSGLQIPVFFDNNCELNSWLYNNPPDEEYKKLAFNFLCGGAAALVAQISGHLRCQTLSGLTGANPYPNSNILSLTPTLVGSRCQVHLYAKEVHYSPGDDGMTIPLQWRQSQPLSSKRQLDLTSETINPAFDTETMELTFTHNGGFQIINNLRIEPGCIIFHGSSQALFIVDTVVANAGDWDISATMVTNYYVNASQVLSPIATVNPTGPIYIYQTFHKVTGFQWRGDVSTASTIVTNMVRTNGEGTGVSNDFKIGDLVWNNLSTFDCVFAANTKITDISGTSITLSANPLITGTGVPIELYR